MEMYQNHQKLKDAREDGKAMELNVQNTTTRLEQEKVTFHIEPHFHYHIQAEVR